MFLVQDNGPILFALLNVYMSVSRLKNKVLGESPPSGSVSS